MSEEKMEVAEDAVPMEAECDDPKAWAEARRKIEEIPNPCNLNSGLFDYLFANKYKAASEDPRAGIATEMCCKLLSKDYLLDVFYNGNLCDSYPAKMLIVKNPRNPAERQKKIPLNLNQLYKMAKQSSYARCRGRFPIGVIFFDGKFICRSSTLAIWYDCKMRVYMDAFKTLFHEGKSEAFEMIVSDLAPGSVDIQDSYQLRQRIDSYLLDQFRVGTIVDLMVENEKHYLKYLAVTTSEKAYGLTRYHNKYQIVAIPYPGCEFFTEFHKNGFHASEATFDWPTPMCTADIYIPPEPPVNMEVNWNTYRSWTLGEITYNYMMYILKYLETSKKGMLIHCISGWDRTPLFISLIRISLWADGLIHQSLNEYELLYLTVAYDWLLFSHGLVDRMSKNEDVFLFCFVFLKEMYSEEFAITARPPSDSTNGNGSSQSDEECEELPVDIAARMFCKEAAPEADIYYPIAHTSPTSKSSAPSPAKLVKSPRSTADLLNVRRSTALAIPGSDKSSSQGDGESVDSFGSWQMMSPGAPSPISRPPSSQSVDSDMSAGSWHMASEDQSDTFAESELTSESSRKDRLSAIRKLFLICYAQAAVRQRKYDHQPRVYAKLYDLLTKGDAPSPKKADSTNGNAPTDRQ